MRRIYYLGRCEDIPESPFAVLFKGGRYYKGLKDIFNMVGVYKEHSWEQVFISVPEHVEIPFDLSGCPVTFLPEKGRWQYREGVFVELDAGYFSNIEYFKGNGTVLSVHNYPYEFTEDISKFMLTVDSKYGRYFHWDWGMTLEDNLSYLRNRLNE